MVLFEQVESARNDERNGDMGLRRDAKWAWVCYWLGEKSFKKIGAQQNAQRCAALTGPLSHAVGVSPIVIRLGLTLNP